MRSGHRAALHWRLSPFVLAALFFFHGIGADVYADVLRLSLPGGRTVNADFRPGDVRAPAVLVLHGFLQTNEFLATQNIINGLFAEGNTILGPNLSLGVPNRQVSRQCQAAHQHTFDEDLREIDFWVEWLRKRGHRSVILVGHSWGSQIALGYAQTYSRAPVDAVIAISLVHDEQGPKLRAKQIAEAKSRLARKDTSLHGYALSFCKSFMATPSSYLSYAHWDDARVLQTLMQLRSRGLPVYAIVGSKDTRIDDKWVRELRQRVTRLTVVDGANHFFSSVHEFELVDRLSAIVTDRRLNAQR